VVPRSRRYNDETKSTARSMTAEFGKTCFLGHNKSVSLHSNKASEDLYKHWWNSRQVKYSYVTVHLNPQGNNSVL